MIAATRSIVDAFVRATQRSSHSRTDPYYYLSGSFLASPHVAAISALVLQEHPGTSQADMQFILRLAAAGNPLAADDAVVYFPYENPPFYSATWDGGDYGMGFLRADLALRKANLLSRPQPSASCFHPPSPATRRR